MKRIDAFVIGTIALAIAAHIVLALVGGSPDEAAHRLALILAAGR